MTCDAAPHMDRFAILRALVAEAQAGERLSDRILTVDYLESLSADRGGAPRDLASSAGLWRLGAPPATVADVARRLLAHLRDGGPWTLPEPREQSRNRRDGAAKPEISL